MALIRGGSPAPAPRADGLPEEVPTEIPRGRGGRPKIRALVNGKQTETLVEYTRASTLGKALEDVFRIHRSDLRRVVFALSRRPDYVLRAGAVAGQEDRKDKDELTEVAELAREYAGGNSGATRGTAMHKLSERVDAGEDLSYLSEQELDALRRYRELMASVRVVATECFVVNDGLQAAGTFDRVVELLRDTEVWVPDENGDMQLAAVLPAGSRIGIDLKTNEDAKYFGAVYSVQQAVYFVDSCPYSAAEGRGAWPDGIAPSSEWALILHLPVGSIADAGFYWVNLRTGAELARHAVVTRAMQKRDDLFYPAELAPPAVGTTSAQVVKVGLMAQIRQAADEAAIGALNDANEDIWDEDCNRMARARVRELALAAPPAAAPVAEPVEDSVDAIASGPDSPTLLELIEQAPDEATLDALYTAAGDEWGSEHNVAAQARFAIIDAARAAAS